MSETNDRSDMQALTGQAHRLIQAISEAIMSTAETAAERIQLAAQVARIEQRMEAFGAVLDAIQAQRDRLEAQMAAAKGSRKALLARQVEMLQQQELAVLARIDVPAPVAERAVLALTEPEEEGGAEKVYERDGRRFRRKESAG